MTWEQKIEACQAIGDFSLRMRKQGDWYVNHQSVEKGNGAILEGGCVSNAKTPQEAVEQYWEWLTTYGEGEFICVRVMREDRQELRWNGFMWARWSQRLRGR